MSALNKQTKPLDSLNISGSDTSISLRDYYKYKEGLQTKNSWVPDLRSKKEKNKENMPLAIYELSEDDPVITDTENVSIEPYYGEDSIKTLHNYDCVSTHLTHGGEGVYDTYIADQDIHRDCITKKSRALSVFEDAVREACYSLIYDQYKIITPFLINRKLTGNNKDTLSRIRYDDIDTALDNIKSTFIKITTKDGDPVIPASSLLPFEKSRKNGKKIWIIKSTPQLLVYEIKTQQYRRYEDSYNNILNENNKPVRLSRNGICFRKLLLDRILLLQRNGTLNNTYEIVKLLESDVGIKHKEAVKHKQQFLDLISKILDYYRRIKLLNDFNIEDGRIVLMT